MLIIVLMIIAGIFGLGLLIAIPIVCMTSSQKSKLDKVNLSNLKDWERDKYQVFAAQLGRSKLPRPKGRGI